MSHFIQNTGENSLSQIINNLSFEESKIDRLVYQLYGLTEDEIKIVVVTN